MIQNARGHRGELQGVSAAEEERRRERRKHRKRVARIVVEHWKWVSRSALLAARYHRQRLLVSALKSFRRNVSDRRLQLRTALVLHHKRLFACLEACLFAWKERTQAQRARSSIVRGFERRWTLGVLNRVFVDWKGFSSYKKDRRGWLRRAECYWEFSLASLCVRGWCERKNELCSKREANLLALHYWSRSTCRTALRGFQEYRDKRSLVRVLEMRAGEFWRCNIVQVCVVEWAKYCSAAGDGGRKGMEKLQHLQGVLWESKVRDVICEWHLRVIECKWEKFQMRRAEAHNEKILQEKALGRYFRRCEYL